MFRSAKDHFIEGMRYPLAADAQRTPPVSCEFAVGDLVTFTNDNGVVFPDHIVTGFSPTVDYGRFVYFDHDALWFPVDPKNLSMQVSTDPDRMEKLKALGFDSEADYAEHHRVLHDCKHLAAKQLAASAGKALVTAYPFGYRSSDSEP